MKIGVDMDGVVYDFDQAAVNVFKLNRGPEFLSDGKRFALSNPVEKHWDYLQEIVGERNWRWFWAVAVTEYQVFAEGSAYKNADEELRSLCADHEVYIITSRNRRHAWQTYTWLGERRLAPRAVIHDRHKAQLAKTLELDAFIDDNQDQLAELVKVRGLYVYRQERPWNRGFETNYYRYGSVVNLQELAERLDTRRKVA